MDKYKEVQTAVENLKSRIEKPQEGVENYGSGYSMDAIVYKKEAIVFPKEIYEVLQEEGGQAGLIEGVSSVWATGGGKLVIWNYSTHMINEIETKQERVRTVVAITPRKDMFTSDVQHCVLLFTEASVSMMCLCKNPMAYISMDISVELPMEMMCVCEAKGRIFMGGVDGSVYEFVYKENSWLKGPAARIVSHTRGLVRTFLPFLYVFRQRSAVKQMVETSRGLLVLYADNTVEAYELKKGLKRIKRADLPELKKPGQGPAQLVQAQLAQAERKTCQAYLVLSDASRIFLDCNACVLGRRDMPAARVRARMPAPSAIRGECFYQTGKNMVSVGSKDSEMIITVISRNKKENASLENCCTVISDTKYTQVASLSGKQWLNSAEGLVMGEEVAFLAAERVDIYQIMNGVELMERAGTNPEGMFAFVQRNGVEQALIAALYSVAVDAASPAVHGFFRKAEEFQKRAVTACAAIVVYKIWSIDMHALLKDSAGLSVSEYIAEVESAIEKTKRLKHFIIKECTSMKAIRISDNTVIDMLENIEETLEYINILMEADALYIFDKVEREEKVQTFFTFSSFLVPVSSLRKATLAALMDLNLRQKSSIDGVAMELNERCPSLFALTDTFLLKGKEAVEKALRASNEEDKKWYLMKSTEFFTKTAAKKYLDEIVELYSSIDFSAGIMCAVRNGFNSITEEQASEYFAKMRYTEGILRDGLTDKRPAFCSALLTSAVRKIKEGVLPTDTLLKIRSAFLEDYLECLDRTPGADIDLRDLIWKYHMKNENFSAAALYLLRAAERPAPEIALQQRIEYISIASTVQAVAQKNNSSPAIKHIKNYTPRLGTNAKERLEMAQKQAEVLGMLSRTYSIEEKYNEEMEIVEETFAQLNTVLLSFEELFEICVMFGFSALALKIAAKGEIEDVELAKDLWKDMLAGTYEQAIELLKENPDILPGAFLDLVFDILLMKKIEAPQEGSNIGMDLVSLGEPVMRVVDMLHKKATSTKHANPWSKKVVLEQATAFCEAQNLAEAARRFSAFKSALGI